MELELRINMDNAAFNERIVPETKRLFEDVLAQIGSGHLEGRIMDVNGNSVGNWIISGSEQRYEEE